MHCPTALKENPFLNPEIKKPQNLGEAKGAGQFGLCLRLGSQRKLRQRWAAQGFARLWCVCVCVCVIVCLCVVYGGKEGGGP